MAGTLYIVATPIGNLEDVTLRGIRILSEVDIILAEDTRVSRKLLDFIYSHHTQSTIHQSPTKAKLLSYHQHSGESRKLEILNYLLQGKNTALVTDAGTPGISDPGNELIDYLLSYAPDLKVIPITGASAITTALSVSGFNTSKFLFLGYWPKKKVTKLLKLIKETKLPIVFYESPHRLVRTLQTIEKAFGSYHRVLVARELTKLHETLYRDKIGNVIDQLKDQKIKGEVVVVVEM